MAVSKAGPLRRRDARGVCCTERGPPAPSQSFSSGHAVRPVCPAWTRPAVSPNRHLRPPVFLGVADRTEALELAGQESRPIAPVMHDMIGDRGRCHDVSRQAQRAQRLSPQLCPTQPAPAFELVPASPRITPWGFAFAGHRFPLWPPSGANPSLSIPSIRVPISVVCNSRTGFP